MEGTKFKKKPRLKNRGLEWTKNKIRTTALFSVICNSTGQY